MDKTVFRVYPDGEVIALFPQIAGQIGGYLCSSYLHVGQHGAANTHIVVRQTKLASLTEYRPLLKELEQIGYNPVPAKRCTWNDYKIRRKQTESWS